MHSQAVVKRLRSFSHASTHHKLTQEDGTLAKRLAPEGATLPVGSPIAHLAEEGAGPSDVAAAAACRLATSDVYDESQARVRVLEWQSFLKESKEEPGCSKCMG